MTETTTPAPAAKPEPAPAEPVDPNGIFIAVGRRKAAVARIRLRVGTGEIKFNKKRTLEEYFGREQDRLLCIAPLRLIGAQKKYDITVNVRGGGPAGQAGAIRLGIARALTKVEPAQYGALKAAGLLTRDSRSVERKKPGKAGARRSFQFSKR